MLGETVRCSWEGRTGEHVRCSGEVAKEPMFKLKDEGEVVSKPRGDQGLLWVKKTG